MRPISTDTVYGRHRILALVLGAACGLVALSLVSALAAVGLSLAIVTTLWIARDTRRWIPVFWVTLAAVPAISMTSVGGTFAVSDLVMALGLLILVIHPRSRARRSSSLLWCFAGLSAIQLMSILAADVEAASWLPSILRVVRSAGSLVVLGYIMRTEWDDRSTNSLVYLLLVVGGLANLVTILQFVFQWDVLVRAEQYAWVNGSKYLRASGVFGEANQAGGFAALIAILHIGYYQQVQFRHRDRKTWLTILGLSVSLFALIITSSRGALINVVIGSVILFTKVGGATRRKLTILFAVPFTGLYLFSPEFSNYVVQRLSSIFAGLQNNADATLGGRLSNWNVLLRLVQESPVLGTGYRLAAEAFNHTAVAVSDNNLIMALVETGLVGFCVMAILLVNALWKAIVLIRQDRPMAVAVGAAMIGFIAQGFVVDSLTYWRLVPILFGLLELEWRLLRDRRRTENEITPSLVVR